MSSTPETSYIYVLSEMEFDDDYKRADARWEVLQAFINEEDAYLEANRTLDYYTNELIQDREIEPTEYEVEELMSIDEIREDIKSGRPLEPEDILLVNEACEEEKDFKKAFEFGLEFLKVLNKPTYTMKRGKYFKVEKVELVKHLNA